MGSLPNDPRPAAPPFAAVMATLLMTIGPRDERDADARAAARAGAAGEARTTAGPATRAAARGVDDADGHFKSGVRQIRDTV